MHPVNRVRQPPPLNRHWTGPRCGGKRTLVLFRSAFSSLISSSRSLSRSCNSVSSLLNCMHSYRCKHTYENFSHKLNSTPKKLESARKSAYLCQVK